jgi:hypothetical protein
LIYALEASPSIVAFRCSALKVKRSGATITHGAVHSSQRASSTWVRATPSVALNPTQPLFSIHDLIHTLQFDSIGSEDDMSDLHKWAVERKQLILKEISTFLVCVRIYIQKE